MKAMSVVVFSMLAVACSNHDVPRSTENQEQLELDALEVLFRHQFANNASAAQQNAAAYCLSLREDDPPAKFVERFRNDQPQVLPVSKCTSDPFEGVRIEGVNGIALVHYVTEISCSEKQCEAEGGYYEAGLSASGNNYVLHLGTDNVWRVTSDKMNWIS